MTGYANGDFGPDEKVTREQVMTMIARAMKLTKLAPDLSDDDIDALLSGCADFTDLSDFAKAGLAACLKTEVVTGRGVGTIAPKENMTKAEAAVIVQRMLINSGSIS